MVADINIEEDDLVYSLIFSPSCVYIVLSCLVNFTSLTVEHKIVVDTLGEEYLENGTFI